MSTSLEKLSQTVEQLQKRVDDFELIQEDELYVVADAAKFLKVSPATIYRFVQTTDIPYCKNTGTLYFLRSELFKWIKNASVNYQHK